MLKFYSWDLRSTWTPIRYQNVRPSFPVNFCRRQPGFYGGEHTLSRYPLFWFSSLSSQSPLYDFRLNFVIVSSACRYRILFWGLALRSTWNPIQCQNVRPSFPANSYRRQPVLYEGGRTLSRYPLSWFSMFSSLQLLIFVIYFILWTGCDFFSYRDCRQCFSSGSISKRIPQVSGKDLNALAGAVPTRMNTVLLSTFLDNQSPFLSCIVQNPFYTAVCSKIAS